jgi:spore coat protein U-like protein
MKWSNAVLSALSVAALGLLALGLTSTSAFATTTQTSNFTVGVTVNNSCNISTSNLAFGASPGYLGAVMNAQSTITVTCNTNTGMQSYTVGLSGGGSNNDTARQMTITGGGSSTLNYTLTSVSYTGSNWGNTATTGWVTEPANTGSTSLTVFGTIPAGQVVAQGTYSDTITATITY